MSITAFNMGYLCDGWFYQYIHPIMLTPVATTAEGHCEDQIYHQQLATVDVFSGPAVSRCYVLPQLPVWAQL